MRLLLAAISGSTVHRVVQLSPSFLPVPSLDSTRELTAHLALAAVHAYAGGNVYVYNLQSELDAPGEYIIDHEQSTLSFLPPATAPDSSRGSDDNTPTSVAKGAGAFHVSRLDSVAVITSATNITFKNLELRYARGGGVIVRENGIFGPFIYKMHHFAKTGSGQT